MLPANGSPVVVGSHLTATSAGDAVLVANARGTDSSGNTLTMKQALTVFVTNPPTTEADYDKLVTSVLLDVNSITGQALNTIANTEGDSFGLRPETRRRVSRTARGRHRARYLP